jgi:hypothetical protein
MKTTKTLSPIEKPILDVRDLLADKSIHVFGVVADKNQGKSNLLYNMIHVLQTHAPETHIVGFRLFAQVPGVLHLNTLTELAKIRDSFIIIDELKTIVDTDNRREMSIFLEILQTLYHSNNTIVVSGLAHNFNGKLSGEIEVFVFKQTTLISIVKRSNLDYILRSFRSEGKASKNEYVLAMPVNGALVYHPYKMKNWHYIDVPYMPQYDTKKDNSPVIRWKED